MVVIVNIVINENISDFVSTINFRTNPLFYNNFEILFFIGNGEN